MSVMLCPYILCVALLVGLFVMCVCELFGETICLGVVVILLLNVMEVFSVGGGVRLDRPCMIFQRMCVCACDHSVHLSVPSIDFVDVFVCRRLYPHLRV